MIWGENSLFRKHPHICHHCFYQHVVSPPATPQPTTPRPRPPRSSTFRSLDCARLDAGATRGAWQQVSQNHGMANYPPQLLQDFGTIKQYELRLLSRFGAMKHEIQNLTSIFRGTEQDMARKEALPG